MRFLRLSLAASAGVPPARTSLYHGQRILPDKVSVATAGLANEDTVAIAVAPDPSMATVADDGVVYIWRLADSHCLHRLSGQDSLVTAVAWSVDGGCVATATCTRQGSWVRLWCSQDGGLWRELKSYSAAPLTTLAFSHDGNHVGAASEDGSVMLWYRWNGSCVQSFHAHTKPARSLVFSSCESLVCSASDDGTVQVCSTDNGGRRVALGPLPGCPAMLCATFSPDATLVATVSPDGLPRQWRVSDGTCVQTFRFDWPDVASAIVAPDGLAIAVFGQGGFAAIWCTCEDNARAYDTTGCSPLALASGGRLAAYGSRQKGLVDLLDVQRGEVFKQVGDRGSGRMTAASFSL